MSYQSLRDRRYPYNVAIEDDPFTEIWGAGMRYNFVHIPGAEPYVGTDISLSLAITVHKKTSPRDTAITLGILYWSPDWLFVSRKGSLILLADGNRIVLDGAMESSEREVVSGGDVEEAMLYRLDSANLHTLLTSRVIRGALIGSRGRVEFILTPLNIQRMRQFADRFRLI